jgi:two-component system, sensor histidine kinase and response regulator
MAGVQAFTQRRVAPSHAGCMVRGYHNIYTMDKPVPLRDSSASEGETAMRLRGLPGLDVDAGLAFVGNSADVYVRLLKRFVQLHEVDVHQMIAHAEDAERSTLQTLAHSIKGGAATLGLSGLAGLAKQLEEAAGGEAPPARLVELARALEAAHGSLSRHLAQASITNPAERLA